MTVWLAEGGASVLADGVHHARTVGGALGVLALLLPQLIERHRNALVMPRDQHEHRVAHLRADFAATEGADFAEAELWPPRDIVNNTARLQGRPTE